MKKRKRAQVSALEGLEPVQPNVAGIDVSSTQAHVCGPGREDGLERLALFRTTTNELLALARWLKQREVESVALESTGVYWIPVAEVLEGQGIEVLLVDSRPLRRVPGRKTDFSDAQWIQTLHSYGLLKGCFRPAGEVGQIRSLVRNKGVLVAEQGDWMRRMQKCLDQMNVRIHHAVADVSGATGMAILRAIVAGERDPRRLAALRDPRCRKSEEEIAEHLTGHWREDHLFSLGQALRIYDRLGESVEEYSREIERRLEQITPAERRGEKAPPPVQKEKARTLKRRKQTARRDLLFALAGCDLTMIDGVGVETAETVVSEYGLDFSRFATESEFVSHLRLSPKQAISGGKPLPQRKHSLTSSRTAKVLRMAAVSLKHSATALGAYFRRIASRKGLGVAIFACARKLAQLIYRMMRWGQGYMDIGVQAYEERFRAQQIRRIRSTAQQLGLVVVEGGGRGGLR